MARKSLEERFWEKVNKNSGVFGADGLYPTECYVWTARKKNTGYGQIQRKGKCERAHRVSWELCFGPIPDKQCVLHKCDNPSCVRQDHLFLGTQLENIADRDQKKRLAPGIGEQNNNAKLTTKDIIAIRELYAKNLTRIAIAHIFNVSRSYVDKIIAQKVRKQS
jgi:hypothetical protein